MRATVYSPRAAEKNTTWEIIGAAIEVHRALGPGMLESAYCACLAHEFGLRNLPFEREKPLDIHYKQLTVEHAFRADFIVNGEVVVEVKALEDLAKVHDAQVLTYLRVSGLRVGLLFNFNVYNLRQGMKRLVL